MTVEMIGFCDFAQDNGGKLTVVGAFDTVFSKAFPTMHPQMAFVLKMRFSIAEKGRHHLKVTFDSSKKKNALPPVDAQVDVQVFNTASSPVQFVSLFLQTQFEGPDTIMASVELDGKEVANTPLYIQRLA